MAYLDSIVSKPIVPALRDCSSEFSSVLSHPVIPSIILLSTGIFLAKKTYEKHQQAIGFNSLINRNGLTSEGKRRYLRHKREARIKEIGYLATSALATILSAIFLRRTIF
ncbi:MAG: hypothetical protein K1000chlam1_01333 [Candidatus Anoxychlamydiales bacterium]|nr:hypothetical protein [Candidatus Anoxychlamydiales bacterium]